MHIVHFDLPDVNDSIGGGGPWRTFEINRRIAKTHHVTVVTSRWAGMADAEVRDGVHYVRIGKAARYPRNVPAYFRAIPSALRHLPHDLVVEDFAPPWSVFFTPLYTRKPVIASVQYIYTDLLEKEYHLPFGMVERMGYRLYHHFVALPPAVPYIRARNSKADIHTTTNGIDQRAFDYAGLPEEDAICYLGRIDYYPKGLDLLFAAFAKIAPTCQTRLRMLGDGNDLPMVRQVVQQMGLADRVDFMGRIDGPERFYQVGTSKIVCQPSRRETFSLASAEALAVGRPLVAFDMPDLSYNAEVAAVVPCYDVEAYAAKLQFLLDHPEARAALSEKGRAHARRYKWEDVAAAQLAYYEKVMIEHRVRAGA